MGILRHSLFVDVDSRPDIPRGHTSIGSAPGKSALGADPTGSSTEAARMAARQRKRSMPPKSATQLPNDSMTALRKFDRGIV